MQLLFLDGLLCEDNGSGMLCLYYLAATNVKLLLRFQVGKAFYPVKLCSNDQCVPGLPRIDHSGITKGLPVGLNHFELHSPLS